MANLEGYFHPETETYKYWDTNQEVKLKELVLTGKYSFKDIGKIMGRSGQSCQDHSKVMNLSNSYIRRLYSVNENFWSNPNLVNCYYSGFCAADSYIHKIQKRFTLEIQKLDKDWLSTFKEKIEFTGPILEYTRPKFNSTTVKIILNNAKWINDLERNFNIVPQKTYRLSPPNISNNFLELCWLVGMTDGDGSICLTSRKGKQDLIFHFVSSSEKILEYIKDLINKNLPSSIYSIRKNREQFIKKINKFNCYQYGVAGVRAILLFELLRTLPLPFRLARKWDRIEILEFIETQKLKFNYFFNVIPKNFYESLISQPASLSVTTSKELKEKEILI